MKRIQSVLMVGWFLCLFAATAVAENLLTIGETTKLIRNAQPKLAEANGWAFDLHDVFQELEIPANRENLCAALAIVDQESNFAADPQVAGLGAISEAALRRKFDRVPLGGAIAIRWLENTPSPEASFMSRIRGAKTEHDLDLAYRALVAYAGKTSNLDVVMRLGVMNSFIEEKNDIDTVGSMQVSVKFALDDAKSQRWLPMSLDDQYAVRDKLYTRRGGLYYGVKQLLGYDTGYRQKIFRFADYNAGRYAARNAAFQTVVAKLASQPLIADGDLLRYSKNGRPAKTATNTEKAIRAANTKHNLGFDNQSIRADLLLEKQLTFTGTRTFVALRDLYKIKTGKEAPFAQLPEIALDSPKLSHGFSTKRFAERVNQRYQHCVAVK